MDPITAAAIMSSGQLLASAFGLHEQRKQASRELGMQGAQGTYDMTQNQLAQQQKSQQTALSDLIAAYKSNLGA